MALAKHHCRSEFQDSRYGAGIRVVNAVGKTAAGKAIEEFRCSVCGQTVDKAMLVVKKGR